MINADQKAQILKKPLLQAQLAQLEQRLKELIEQEREKRALVAAARAEAKAEADKVLAEQLAEKLAEQEKELTAKFEKEKADIKKEAETGLLVLSQFLALAAHRRAEEADQTADENMACEGVLLNIYSGDASGVETMLKLVRGVKEPTKSVTGETLKTTCE